MSVEGAQPALVVDDGELDDVVALLASLGVPFEHLRGGRVPGSLEPPALLFVTTSRRARLAEPWAGRGDAPTRICITTEDSNTARAMLRRVGFDYLVRRPFHPFALRLLVLRALYGGEERRRSSRVAIGAPTSYRVGLRRHPATLADLSLGGCRLLTSQPLPQGSRVSVHLPRDVVDARAVWLRARVSRVDAPTGAGQHVVALLFEGITVAKQQKLLVALRKLATGPAVLARQQGEGAPVAAVNPLAAPARATPGAPDRCAGKPASPTPAAAPARMEERRKSPRAAYSGEVMHLGEEAGRVLLGRDISAGGMRVEPHDDLEAGQVLRLAVYGAPGEAPVMVRARVVRNDGPAGVGLQFEGLAPAAARRIEALMAQLPQVEPLQGGEGDALGSVVSRVLDESDAD